jgi:cobalt-zinc-cadmium efflux system protein
LALAILAIEIVGGIVSNSLALFADAGHVLGDAAALALALGAIQLAARPGSRRRTFGWYRAEILAALLNGAALLVIAGVIVWRAVVRIGDDPEVAGVELVAFALTGLAVNLVSAALLHGGQRDNLNVRGAYYHVVGDALGSVGALVAGVVIVASGWTAIDVIASVAIAALIVVAAARLMAEATNVLLEAAPRGIAVEAVAEEICGVEGVIGVHDLHLWTVTSGFAALSVHVEIGDETDPADVLSPVTRRLQDRFGLQHITLQPESSALHNVMQCCDLPDRQTLGAYSTGHRWGVADQHERQ